MYISNEIIFNQTFPINTLSGRSMAALLGWTWYFEAKFKDTTMMIITPGSHDKSLNGVLFQICSQ